MAQDSPPNGWGPTICGINVKLPAVTGVPEAVSVMYCEPVLVKFPEAEKIIPLTFDV